MTTKPTTSLPRTERPDAPAYLTRHLSRQAVPSARDSDPDDERDESTPRYLR